MSRSHGVALIGAGGIGELRARAVAAAKGVHLAVVADVDEVAAGKLAARAGATATGDWRQAVADPAVDLVIVSTPPSLHAEMTVVAATEGKHVVCEKPLARTVEEGERMCAAAEAAGVQLKTGFNHRYFPAMGFVRRLIDSGKLGEVVRVKARGGHGGGDEFGPSWITDPEVTGGGSLVDNGIHLLDLVRFMIGEVDRAKGYVDNLVWPFDGAEDNSFALFRTATGAIASVEASWTDWQGYHFSVEVCGTRGWALASYPPMWVKWGEMAEPGAATRRHVERFPLFQVNERLRGWRWTIVRSFVTELELFVAGIVRGKPTAATGRDGLRTLEMADAIYESSRRGVEVEL